ncbi:hypothetical protein BAUCODRAFT_24254 [Baudoinia panamericana UAMH 10762]|uniref:Calcineurin-like phosphoesterase domain-containing protein n=1 Tax=Baudoinia panamericana (strain UAMH 10762) TaxID=717646 RepID=M2NC91_BAUPA|nr:uncharacterized protein BAUCODRAFT_24254 [Baudoinia panamericana UAMH 10762]EMC96490.1 hypothetical protein BAUCODRAFT_24254 [Baudoinia panamericana UAMH 10762]
MSSFKYLLLHGLLASLTTSHGLQRRASALDQTLTNTIPNLSGPILYFNGSGPVPGINVTTPEPAPLPALSTQQITNSVLQELYAIGTGKLGNNICQICQSSLEVLHLASLVLSQDSITQILIDSCVAFNLTAYTDGGSCQSYVSGTGGLGPYAAQLLQKMSLATGDMQAFCYYEFSLCPAPPVVAINESEWFTPKPASKMVAPPPSGRTVNVLHFSDWHMDPRFDVGSEANCTNGLCCRFDSVNSALHTTTSNASLPASRFGDFLCDTPPDLGLSAFQSMRQNVNFSSVPFAIFTGDIVSHDRTNQESQALTSYEEQIAYDTFKAQLGNIPVYATLGNHDSWPSGFNEPNGFRNDSLPNEMSWNYQLVSAAWQKEGWLDEVAAYYAATHYGAYATTTSSGLRIISINSDFWYTPNIFNYYNYTNPDKSGILRFLAGELASAEQAGQRVWILGHVPSGGSSAVANPSVLFHSIVARYSPATIAGIRLFSGLTNDSFFGHTHKDQKQIFYDLQRGNVSANSSSVVTNYTNINYNAPISVAYIGPSIVPLTNYNAGWSVYQVDAATFEIVNGQTYFANISNSLTWNSEPVWEFEYDIRTIYDPTHQWPATAPLNATFWDNVTQRMMSNNTLISEYLYLSTKQSARTPACTGNCLRTSICQIRSSNRAVFDTC